MVQQFNFNTGNYLVYFTTPNCVYCKAFNSTWDTFVAKLKAQKSSVKAIKISTEQNYDIVSNAPDVFAYPSIYAFSNGQFTEFDDQRSVESLMKFTKKELSSTKQTAGKRRRTKLYRRSQRNRRKRGGSVGAPFTYSPSSLLVQPSNPPCAQHNGSPVDIMSAVPPAQQASGPNDAMPQPSYNAGLYTGPPFDGPWGNIPVTPTAAGTTHDALRSANPPPGARNMYATGATNRPGNSFSAKPGVNHYNGGHNSKMYNIKCTAPKGGSRRRRKGLSRRNRRSKRRGGLNLQSANMDDGAPFHPTLSAPGRKN